MIGLLFLAQLFHAAGCHRLPDVPPYFMNNIRCDVAIPLAALTCNHVAGGSHESTRGKIWNCHQTCDGLDVSVPCPVQPQ